MILSQIHIVNYKNYEEVQVDLHPEFNVVTGLNGEGKTNFIDAIHYLGLTRSYFFNVDSYNYRHETDFLRIEGKFKEGRKRKTIVAKLRKRSSKVFENNKKKYERLLQHIGTIPIVMIAPKDQALITDGSEERRRFIDSTISQMDQEYLTALVQYNHVLKQRNQMLKDHKNTHIDFELLDIYDEKLVSVGKIIHEKRKQYLEFMAPIFHDNYQMISGQQEKCIFDYHSKLHDHDFEKLLKGNRDKDRILGRTTVGIHKDDLVFFNEENMIKHVGSQGQQKSFILALKLSQYELIFSEKKIKPIILLDDIFDKLDSKRVLQLTQLLKSSKIGQVFITDTEEERLNTIFKELDYSFSHFQVKENQIQKVN